MVNSTYSVFQETLIGFERGFQVRHIATTDLEVCEPGEEIQSVFQRFPEYDQIPVKNGSKIIGILERDGVVGGIVGDHMRSLDESILVAADEPLLNFLPLMADSPLYRLVLYGTSIHGIVTRSDILKLPVRLLGFALVTNLEMIMREVISRRMPDNNSWMQLLSDGRLAKLMERKALYAEKRSDPPLIELTEFCDNYTILRKHLHLKKEFDKDLNDIQEMRDLLAHAGNYAAGNMQLQDFLDNMKKTRTWTDQLSQYLA